MKNLQKGFAIIPLIIILALLVIGGGTYIVLQNKSSSQNTPITDNNQNTEINTSNDQAVFVGTKKTFLPEKIVSIDTTKKTFVANYESRQAPFTIPTEFSVVPETTIKKENNLLNFNNLAVNDVVWIRAYGKGKDKYAAKNVIITNDWRSSQIIIKKIETNKITAEVFLSPQRRGEQTILTIIPETEIRKGKAEDGENRKVVGLNNLAVGDIASVVEVGFGVHSADDKGPFYTTEIDVVSPYYCDQYLKPTGCIEKDQSANPTTQTKTYTSTQYGFSLQYPADTQINDSDLGKKNFFQPIATNGNLSIEVMQPASNCYDGITSGIDPSYKTINGVNFIVWSLSKEFSTGSDTWATAREYCAVHSGIEYKIFSKLPYKAGTTPLDVDKDAVLNQMVASFKLN